jgi:hypothetical protein
MRILVKIPQPVEQVHLDAISHIKGQFNRTLRHDQWDWHTVWVLLGRPSRSPASQIARLLGQLRTALKDGDESICS